jgi:hypothetical protein
MSFKPGFHFRRQIQIAYHVVTEGTEIKPLNKCGLSMISAQKQNQKLRQLTE